MENSPCETFEKTCSSINLQQISNTKSEESHFREKSIEEKYHEHFAITTTSLQQGHLDYFSPSAGGSAASSSAAGGGGGGAASGSAAGGASTPWSEAALELLELELFCLFDLRRLREHRTENRYVHRKAHVATRKTPSTTPTAMPMRVFVFSSGLPDICLFAMPVSCHLLP